MEEYVSNLDALHHIQQTVLRQLSYKKWVQYSELLPDGMAGNAFNYHLNYLVKHKLIVKSDEGYTLTALGRVVVDAMSHNAKRFKLRPSCGVMLHLTANDGRVLLYFSKRQPLIDHTGLPFGKLRIGATFKSTAERMILRRGITLSDTEDLHYEAPLNICYDENEELVCQRTGQIWSATFTGDPVDFETENGKSFWADPNEYSQFEVQPANLIALNDITIDVNP
ncbi:hypothetical protein KBD20_01240 [Candidatus Saccharibacteria bacterium]|nr:hypothetical protein [Candidatus Saccharibacteria bacterium]